MTDVEKKIFIIIPAYNEHHCIREVVASLLTQDLNHIVIIDDGSTVPLADLLKDLSVTYLRHAVNLGQGAALQTGFNYAKSNCADIVVTFDADGQHDPKDIPNLLHPLLMNEADVALGSRFLGPNKDIPAFKKMILHIARLINFLFSGLLLSDAHNGLRAFGVTALERIRLTENRMAHASEILFEIKRSNLRYKEVPVHISYSPYSRQKGQNSWDSIQILFDLILHKLFR